MASLETECPLCRNNFDVNEHRPKILPCSHTFCKKCIHQLCSEDTIKCPTCCIHIQRRDLIAVTTDFAMLELIDRNTEHSKIDSGNSTSHIESDLDVNNEDPSCAYEVTDSEEIHELTQSSENTFSDTSDFKDELKSSLELQFEEATETSTEVREALTQHFECLRSSYEASVNAIESDFDRLVNMLNRRKKLLKQQLSSQYEDLLAEVEENLETVTLNSMRLESLRNHTNILMSKTEATPNSLRSNAEKIGCEMLELLEPLKQIDLTQRSIHYEAGTDKQTMDKVIRSHGRVSVVKENSD